MNINHNKIRRAHKKSSDGRNCYNSNGHSRSSYNYNSRHNKPDFRAKGLSLLPLALRPGLLGCGSMLSRYFRSSANLVGMIPNHFGSSKISLGMILGHRKTSAICLSMILAVFLSSSICLGMHDDVSAASLTLTIPDSPVTLNLMPSSSEATFTKSTASTIGVKSDAPFGYTLTIAGKSNDNSLLNGSNKIASITNSISENTFKTSADYNNKWGYMPSKLYNLDTNTSSDNTNYLPGPTSSTNTTIDKTSSANASSANNYTLTIAAKVGGAVLSGKYTNNITISTTANSVSYSITYNLQEGTNAPTPNPQTGTTPESSVKLSNTTPTRENYEFLGWCTVIPANNGAAEPNCTGTIYQPNNNFPLTNSANTTTLYAIWRSSVPTTMQDFGDYCKKMAEHQTLTLADTRDGNTYTISRLKDGNCWMVKNLLLGDGTIKTRTLTPNDSDVSSNYELPASSSSGFSSSSTDDLYVNTTSGYYSYNVATAESGRSISSGDALQSICAKGWSLPTKDELKTFVQQYETSKNLQQQPVPGMVIVGGYDVSSHSWSDQGFYWASTAYSSSNAYNINLRTSSIDSIDSTNDPKYRGFPVRCIARGPLTAYTINYHLEDGTDGPSPNPQTGSTYRTSINISSTVPTKTNYTFEGWCTQTPTGQNTTSPTCGGTTYQAGASYPLSSSGSTITLYAMWKQIIRSYTINYHLEDGTDGPSPNPQTGTTTDTSINLSSIAPNKSGYSFEGWCTRTPTKNKTISPSCKGDIYEAGANYTLSSTSDTLDLYAIWKALDGEDCTRSGYSGTAKYYGGYCWMWSDYKTNRSCNQQARLDCPSGWSLPTAAQFETLLNAIGTNYQLYRAKWSGYYCSSTLDNYGSIAVCLSVGSNSAGVTNLNFTLGTGKVRCIAD